MIDQLNSLMRQAQASKMVLTIQSLSETDARVIITSQFDKFDETNKIQRVLSLPLVAQGYTGSLEAELANKLRSVDLTKSNAPESANNQSQPEQAPSEEMLQPETLLTQIDSL